MKSIMKTFFYLILAFFSISIQANEQRYYDVEIIIFENLDIKARQSEKWPSSVELEYPESSLQVGHPWPGHIPKEYNPKLSFKRLFKKELRLSEQVKKIEESDSRRVLLHTGWRQPGMPKDTALTVKIKKTIPAHNNIAENEPSSLQYSNTAQISPWAAQEAGELEGKIQVILARYLHVNADLIFQTQKLKTNDIYQFENAVKEEIKPVVFRLNQTRRRMRSRELHYIDNPVLGLLVLITPYELTQ